MINDPTQGSGWEAGILYDQAMDGPSYPRFEMVWAQIDNGTAYLFNVGPRFAWWNMVTYDAPSRTWPATEQHIFAGTNGYGGVSAQQSGSVTQIKVVTQHQSIVPWVRDPTNVTNPNWSRQPDPITDIWPNSSLASPHVGGDGTLLYYQGENASIALTTSSGYSANATWGTTTDLGIAAMGGTMLHVSSVALQEGANQTTLMFLQEAGNDITVYMGDATSLSKNGTLPL
jgi:hypothetical protein